MKNCQTRSIKPALNVQTSKLVAHPQEHLDSLVAGLQDGSSPVPIAYTTKGFVISLEEALKFVDAAVFTSAKRHLKDIELIVFCGSWQRQKYYEISEAYGYSEKYLKQDIGPNLWKLLSKVLGEPVKKTNFRAAVERRWRVRS